ncbi:SurA N-terminal domain-containing protein, partial [Vibrio campbellii]
MWNKTLLSLAAACSLATAAVQAQPVEMDKVAVIVNEGVILQSDIDTAMKTLRANNADNPQALPSADILREQVIEKLVIDTLQQQEAERIGVRIDDNRLNEAIGEIAASNNQTVEQLTQSVAKEGLT